MTGRRIIAFPSVPKAQGVYIIRNRTNGLFYVGGSVRVRDRLHTHRALLRTGKHYCALMQSDWEAFGEDSFEFELLEQVPIGADLTQREQYWIDNLNAADVGYNRAPNAGSLVGYQMPEGFGEAVRERLTGNKRTPETCRKIGDATKNRSDETRAKLSAAAKRRFSTPEGRAKVGHPQSAETRAKISARAKERFAAKKAREHQEEIRQQGPAAPPPAPDQQEMAA